MTGPGCYALLAPLAGFIADKVSHFYNILGFVVKVNFTKQILVCLSGIH